MSGKDAVLTLLGCGDSYGVPRAGGMWGACDPNEPKNRRTRPSVAVSSGDTTVIVDTGADFHAQTIREGIQDITAVLYSHTHADHVNGIDDLRVYCDRHNRVPIPVQGLPESIEELSVRFPYLFKQKSPLYPAIVEPTLWQDSDFYKPRKIGDVEFIPFLQHHGRIRSVGFRFGDVAYSTDMMGLPEESFEVLSGVKVWIADCACYHMGDSLVHCNWSRLQELNDRVRAPLVYLGHLKFDVDYKSTNVSLPNGYRVPFDGLRIALDGTVLNDES